MDPRIAALRSRGAEACMCLQDTAGQERFRTITSSYYRGAQGVILGAFVLHTRV